MALAMVNVTASVLNWVSSAYDAPTRAVVFGFPIDGNFSIYNWPNSVIMKTIGVFRVEIGSSYA
jgi:hypothetical protein